MFLFRWLAFCFYLSHSNAYPTEQQPLIAEGEDQGLLVSNKRLHGRFLHITGTGAFYITTAHRLPDSDTDELADIHPDLFYKPYSSTEEDAACHRGDGPAGVFGAETTDCDSPITLANATFKWINDHLKDKVDFVIWTGDSSRHDSDEQIPRTEREIIETNELLVHKFEEVFGNDDETDPTNAFTVPIIPNFGNNDIMPHNIMDPGPNRWTQQYLSVWRKFIPEEQRHGFSTGGWFSVEVIPNRLTVFSLNTMYFFEHNTAVDGCAESSEPGYQQMEWLRIQLQFLRNRGMKAILIGHVPPARTEAKLLWDETCWQKYTLWLQRYRDVVITGLYGHMNIEHFLIQDNRDVSDEGLEGRTGYISRTALDDELTTQSTADYLTELRTGWSKIPDAPRTKSKSYSAYRYFYNLYGNLSTKKRPRKTKEDKYLEKIGGEWAERYSVSLVSASVVPNYFPTLRVMEYNISGLDTLPVTHADNGEGATLQEDEKYFYVQDKHGEDEEDSVAIERTKEKDAQGEEMTLKKPKFTMPKPPSKSAPPGPAYSPQTLSLLGYKQYYANLTDINGDFRQNQPVGEDKWHNGRHSGKKPHKDKLRHHKFKYELEYDTRNDSIFGLKDLTVKSYVELAGRIGQYKPRKEDQFEDVKDKHKKHGKKHKHRKAINKVWFTFVDRAFVGTRDNDELHDEFGQEA